MELTSFNESNCVLNKPDDMTHEQCEPASAFKGINVDGFPVVVTCWKCTKEELDEINKTGRVWLMVCGQTMQPSYVTGIKPL